MEITLSSIVSYVVGVPLALMGLLLTIQTPLGVLPLLGGLLILPVIRRRIESRTGVSFSRGATAGIGFLSVVIFIVVLISVGPAGSTAAPGSDVSNVSVSAVDANPSNSNTSLSVEWNSRAQSAIDPDTDDISKYNSEDGQKFVVVRTRITNTGEESIDLTPRMLRLRSSGVEYEYQGFFGSGNSLSGVTLNPGGSHSAWTAFSVPEDTTKAELFANQDAYYDKQIIVEFSHDTEMPIQMED